MAFGPRIEISMILNLRETEEQKVYISSDLHLGHNREFVFEVRGYDNVRKHDEGIADTINQVVRPNDILILLGDFCLNTSHEQFNAYLDSIKCQNIFSLWGNHNNPHEKSVYKKGMIGEVETYPYRYKNFVYYPHYV
jgi:calcineurin-like phosphoesterase family protein